MTGPNPISGLKRMYARSRRWPVRSRIAIVSAVLTAVILIAFALVVGRLVTNRLHADFEKDLQAKAAALANGKFPLVATGGATRLDPNIGEILLDKDAQIRVLGADGSVAYPPGDVPDLGPPKPGSVTEVGNLEVASAQVFSTALGSIVAYVQYARPESSVNATIGRLWLFLAGGVAIGTILAGIAGMAVANRAMRPIAALTAAAGEIATTRDTSRRIPEPESDDEVADLDHGARLGRPEVGDVPGRVGDGPVRSQDPDLGIVGERDLADAGVEPRLPARRDERELTVRKRGGVRLQVLLEVGVQAIADQSADDQSECDQDHRGEHRRDDRDPAPDRPAARAGVDPFQARDRIRTGHRDLTL